MLTVTVLLFWIYFFLLTLVFHVQWLSLHWEISIMLLSLFPLTFHQTQKGMPHFIAQLMTVLVLIGMIFLMIWEMFHGSISLTLVLLLLLGNNVSGSGCNWCIPLHKYQVKPKSSPWYSAAFAAAIAHRVYQFSETCLFGLLVRGKSAILPLLCIYLSWFDVYIPNRNYQVKPHSSPWFSAAFAGVIVHRNHFFHLYQQNKFS